MGTDSHRHTLRRLNLELVLTDPDIGGPAMLARLLGKPKLKAHLSNVRSGRRGIGDELAADIERVTSKPPGWMDQQHSVAGESTANYSVAQAVSYPEESDDLPLLSWEALMTGVVPEIFRTVLPDDALAPDHPAGTEIVWTTRRRASPGRLILTQDQHGQVHARVCHQGRAPGHWLAVPTNPAYISLDSSDPGIAILAVYKGRLEPDDV